MSDVEGVGTGFSDEGGQRWCVSTILIYMVYVSLLHLCAFRSYHGTAPPILTIIYNDSTSRVWFIWFIHTYIHVHI